MTKRTATRIAIAVLCVGAASISTPADAKGIAILKAKKKAAMAQARAPVVVAPVKGVTAPPVQRAAPVPVPIGPLMVRAARLSHCCRSKR